jgi:hypothetical protein
MNFSFDHMSLIKKIFGITMVLIYAGVGILFLLSDSIYVMSGIYRTLLGVVLILYAMFRGYRILKTRYEINNL